jgi:ribonuclease E
MSNNGNGSTRNIVISERDNIAALVEEGKVVEFFIHRGDMLLGDVYLATVENILPSIDAAFVNLGGDRMGFLHASDVPGKGDLKDRLEPKQKILVQIMKEPTGHKGPRVSTSLTLPGRFLVLMPEEKGISISRKILSPKERSRIKSVVSLLKPPGVGIIIRTEAEDKTEDEIKEDLETLLEKWHHIVTTADTVSPPSLIHRDQDLLYRVIREACTDEIKEIFIDSPFGQHRVSQLLQTWNMGKNIKVNVYKGPDSLIVAQNLDKEIKAALQSKVNLPSGGYLYVQPTEALTVIDVNSGRFTSSQTQGETIRQTNLEAIDEIARQLRLRNVGGMVIIDFIDMDNRVDQLAIIEAFEMALMPDKAKPQVGQLSDLGLVEMTRHRQGQSLAEIFTKKCPACNGTGHVIEDLNFAPPSIESDVRSRNVKQRLSQKPKAPVFSPKQEISTGQKVTKPGGQPPSAQKQATQPTQTKQQPKQVQKQQQKPQQQPKAKQPQQIIEPEKTTEPEPTTIYTPPDSFDAVENLTIDKLRKVQVDKKYYPEISKIIRFAGVPLKSAREKFADETSIIDVFTILGEMEAAFARAAAEMTEKPAKAQPVQKPEKKTQQEIAEEIKKDADEKFTGRYGIATEGEDFEELYEPLEEGTEEVISPVKEEKEAAQPAVKTEAEEPSEEGEKDEETEETTESAEDAKKAPVKRGRKTSKTTSARKKRGRPKTK